MVDCLHEHSLCFHRALGRDTLLPKRQEHTFLDLPGAPEIIKDSSAIKGGGPGDVLGG